MLELANAVLEITGSSSTIEHRALPQDDPKQRQPNIDLARRELGWEPTIALRAGLERTVEYFRGVLEPMLRRGCDDGRGGDGLRPLAASDTPAVASDCRSRPGFRILAWQDGVL